MELKKKFEEFIFKKRIRIILFSLIMIIFFYSFFVGVYYIFISKETFSFINLKDNLLLNSKEKLLIKEEKEFIKNYHYEVIKKDGIHKFYDVEIEDINESTEKISFKFNEEYFKNYQIENNELIDYKPNLKESLIINEEQKEIDVELIKAEENKEEIFEKGDKAEYNLFVHSEDKYIKFGENSIELIQVPNTNKEVILFNSSGYYNFTHLLITDEKPYDSLVGYWNFDNDNNNARDFSVSKVTGLYGTNITNEMNNSLFGNYININGVDNNNNGVTFENVLNPNIQKLNITKNGISICMWFNMQGINSGDRQILFARGSTNTNVNSSSYALYFNILNSKQLVFDVSNTTAQLRSSIANASIQLSQWYQVCGTWEESTNTTKIYLNSILNDTDIQKGIGQFEGENGKINGFNLQAGIGGDFVFDRRYFNGSIDEVMLFNSTLNQSSITDIFNNQSKRFKSVGVQLNRQFILNESINNNVSIVGSVFFNQSTNISIQLFNWQKLFGYNVSGRDIKLHYTFDDNYSSITELQTHNLQTILSHNSPENVSGVFNNSIEFNGKNTLIGILDSGFDIPNNETSAFLWVKLSNNQSTGTILELFDNDGLLDNPYIRLSNNGSFLFFNFSVVQGEGDEFGCGTFLIKDKWHYVGYTYNYSNVVLYVDGESCNSEIIYLEPIIQIATTYIGGSFRKLNHYFNGTIDEYTFYNRSLTQTEIKENYVKGFALWNLTNNERNLTLFNSSSFNESFIINNKTTNIYSSFKLISNLNRFYTPILQNLFQISIFNFINTPDTESPYFQNLSYHPQISNSTYNPNNTYYFNITILDNVAVDSVVFVFENTLNYFVNYTPQNLGNGKYSVSLQNVSARLHYYYWWANDTSGNTNGSLFVSGGAQIILQQNSSINLTFNGVQGNITIANNTNVSISVSFILGEGNITLRRNGTKIQDSLAPYINYTFFNTFLIAYRINATHSGGFGFDGFDNENYSLSSAQYFVNVIIPPIPKNLNIILPNENNIPYAQLNKTLQFK